MTFVDVTVPSRSLAIEKIMEIVVKTIIVIYII
jgi:hypothetical protein